MLVAGWYPKSFSGGRAVLPGRRWPENSWASPSTMHHSTNAPAAQPTYRRQWLVALSYVGVVERAHPAAAAQVAIVGPMVVLHTPSAAPQICTTETAREGRHSAKPPPSSMPPDRSDAAE